MMHLGTGKSHSLIALLTFILVACGGSGGGGNGDGNGGNGNNGGGGQLPQLSITGATIGESDSGSQTVTFNLTLGAAAGSDVTIDYASVDTTATAGEDYEAIDGTLTIPSGGTTAEILVTINGDTCFEDDETFAIVLSNISSNAQLAVTSATATITNDDSRRVLSIADAELAEGNSGTSDMLFTISLDAPSCFDTVANYTSNVVSAEADDFEVKTQSFTIPAGVTSVQVPVVIQGDTFYETDETLTVNIEDIPGHTELGDGEAFGTIRTDDLPPLTIFPVEILEGDTVTTVLVVPLELAGITNEISVDYATSDLSATVADNDYTPASGTLVIPAGETQATLQFNIIGDVNPETSEDFLITLSNLVGDAVLQPGLEQTLGTILDDDTPIILEPTLTVVKESSGYENGALPTVFGFHLNTTLTSRVQVDYATSDINAIAGDDYTAVSGRLTLQAGETSAFIEVPTLDDVEIESAEFFNFELTLLTSNVTLAQPRVTGSIVDDDYVGPPLLSAVSRTSLYEGNSGSQDVPVVVYLSDAATDVVTVDYETVDDTALAGSDYTAAGGTLTFAVGETEKLVPITVHGDTVIEAHEQFIFRLSNLTGPAALGYDPLLPPIVVIETDDPFAQVTIDNTGTQEGDTGSSDLVFTVSIDAVAEDPVTVEYISSDGDPGYDHDAVASEDYSPVSGTATIDPGTLQTTVTVSINGDTDNEYDERFSISLANVSQNAEIADGNSIGTIINDDSGPGWGTPQPMDQDGQENALPKVTMNAAGEAMALWSSYWGTHNFETSRYSPAGGWQTHEVITDDLSSFDFDTVMDGAGATTLGWIFGVAKAERHTDALGWNGLFEFDPAGYNDQDYMRLAGNESGSVIAIWKLNTPVTSTDHLMYSIYDPATETWGANGLTSDYLVFEGQFINSADIAMNSSGEAVAVWTESPTGVRASRYYFDTVLNDWTWSTPRSISNELGCCPGFFATGNAPLAGIDDSGNIIAVWHDGSGGVGTGVVANLWAVRYDAGTDSWSEAVLIETSVMDARYPQIVMDPNGNAFVVWMQDNNPDDFWNDTFEIHARRYVHNPANPWTNNWEPEVLVQDSNSRINQFLFDRGLAINRPAFAVLDVPAIAVDSNGNAIMAWSQEIDGEFVLRASRYDLSEVTPTWSPPEKISGTTWPYAILPAIDVDAGGNAIVVWQAGDNEEFGLNDVSEIWVNKYTSP